MIKTRFAPSPTGYIHVGSLRTALYCYLFARKNKGKVILRIEDTDQQRYVEGAVENLVNSFHWMGIDFDEGPQPDGSEKGESGPYTQSQRTEIYKKHAQMLLDSGHAYRCFCTKERLDDMREKQIENKLGTMYDRKCLHLSEQEIEENLKNGIPFVIRQKMPSEKIKFRDLIRGMVQFDGNKVDDQVLVKSDGYPTYHLANVVDDHFMKITHVIRGEEWLPSTPKHIALYQAFGWEKPEFAHLPLLLNADKTKLSKRQGDVAVEDYINKGYTKNAILNFVAFLGWHPGGDEKREIFTLAELEEIFDIEKVHKAGAVFNIEKLDWYNWRWQKEEFFEKLINLAKQISPNVQIEKDRRGQTTFNFEKIENEESFYQQRGELLFELAKTHIDSALFPKTPELMKQLVTVEEHILKKASETQNQIEFYKKLPEYDNELLTHQKMKVDLEVARASLLQCENDLGKLANWNLREITSALMSSVEQLGVKNGQVFWPLRAALSGKNFSPGVFEVANALGKEETIRRIKIAISKV